MARRERKGDTGSEKRVRRNPLFFFMGPPDLGDPNEPRASTRVAMDCTSCGRPMDEHVIDRSQGRSATYCPSPTVDA